MKKNKIERSEKAERLWWWAVAGVSGLMFLMALACSGQTLGENQAGDDTYLEGYAPTDREQDRIDDDGNQITASCDYTGSLAVDHRTETAFALQSVVGAWCDEIDWSDESQALVEGARKTLFAVPPDSGAKPILDLTGLSDLRITFPRDKVLVMAEKAGRDSLFFLDPDNFDRIGRIDASVRYHGTRTSPSRRYLAVADNTSDHAPIHVIDTESMTTTVIPHNGDWLEAMWLNEGDRLLAMVFYDLFGERPRVRLLSWSMQQQDPELFRVEEGVWGAPDLDMTLEGYDADWSFSFSWIGVSPDDRYAAFPVVNKRLDRRDLLILDLDTGDVRQVSRARGPVGFTPDGSTIVSYRMIDNDPRLLLIDVETLETRELDLPLEETQPSFFVTREGNYVAVTGTWGSNSLWLYDIDNDEMKRVATPDQGVHLSEFVSRLGHRELWLVSQDRLHVLDLEAKAMEQLALPWRPRRINLLPGRDLLVLDDVDANRLVFFDPEQRRIVSKVTLPLDGRAGPAPELEPIIDEPGESLVQVHPRIRSRITPIDLSGAVCLGCE